MFYDSLAGTAAQWYMKLRKDQIRTWRDLVRTFMGRYKYMLETVSDRLTFQNMKKGPEENYREYAVRWKNVASMVGPPLTNREENSMFVDTLPSPYYDTLVINAYVEFGDLMYSVGRIEDGIKRGKIVDTGASMMEKKRIVPDEHVRVMSRERRSKEKSHMARDEPVKNHSRPSLYAQVPLVGFLIPQKFVRKRDRDSDSSYPRSYKEKRVKVYHSLPMSYGELLSVLIQKLWDFHHSYKA